MSFPSKDITLEDAKKDYEELQKIKGYKQSNVGNKATDYFMYPYRIKTKTGKWSHKSAWENPEERKKIIANTMKLNKVSESEARNNPSLLRGTLQMMYGSVNQFKPNIAKYLYERYGATKVLDFSAGWGGRLLGAMSADIDYIGIDTNKALNKPYHDIIKTYPHKSKTKIIIGKAENQNYGNMNYDFVFTSPPYADKEKYENMPEYENFNDEFLKPVIEKTYNNLPKGKYYALNIPKEIYNEVKKYIGSYDEKIKLKKSQRTGSGKSYGEFIYVWKK
jgi:16S rRNA G966 N2-methylase RsmD